MLVHTRSQSGDSKDKWSTVVKTNDEEDWKRLRGDFSYHIYNNPSQ